MHVVCTGDYGATSTGRVARIESDFSAVRDTLELGGAPGRAVLAGNGIAYLTAFCDGVLAYDTNAFTVVHGAGDAWLPGVCAADAALYGDRLFVADFGADLVTVLDLPTGTKLEDIPVGDGPIALAVATP
jgi:YVTN family beta-propeller protein